HPTARLTASRLLTGKRENARSRSPFTRRQALVGDLKIPKLAATKVVAKEMSAKHAKNPPRPRVQVALTEIQEEFRAQLKLLKKSCDAYDAGDSDEFRRIALAIRVLIYDHRQSKSVVGQIGLKSIPFLSFSPPVNPRNLMPSHTLVGLSVKSDGAIYWPILDHFLKIPRSCSFNDWWNEEVFCSPGRVSMARSGFILHTANQAGGAHVDPQIDEDFYKIAKANEAGWISKYGEIERPLLDLEKACVRQIGFEVYNTLLPQWISIRGNRTCECDSGKKYRYCHGKGLRPYL
ncbi:MULTISPECIES: hypothetical protein, partial [unclassified Methylobacterium]|uniref:hypothetical protein n=1 Tax=unclassified Methylobacterium TaxID=2615210 RepID=UPI0036F4FEA1